MSGEFIPQIITATGHRPDKLGGYTETTERRLLMVAEAWLDEQEKTSYGLIKYVRVGMALGWDQAVAQACVNVGVPFHAFIPFKGQESKWPADAQVTYRVLLSKAEDRTYTAPPGYAVEKMQLRNIAMVNGPPKCHRILALWNGSRGGTYNCLTYAEGQGVPITNLWDKYVAQP